MFFQSLIGILHPEDKACYYSDVDQKIVTAEAFDVLIQENVYEEKS